MGMIEDAECYSKNKNKSSVFQDITTQDKGQMERGKWKQKAISGTTSVNINVIKIIAAAVLPL